MIVIKTYSPKNQAIKNVSSLQAIGSTKATRKKQTGLVTWDELIRSKGIIRSSEQLQLGELTESSELC